MELAVLCARSNRLADLNRAVDAVNEAIQRDPDRLLLYQDRAGVLDARYLLAGSAADLLGAVGAARRCVEMYPASPDQHLELAELLARAGDDLGSPQLLSEAIDHYRRALELNDARPGTDEARRWSHRRVEQIRQRIATLESPATAPASSRSGLPSTGSGPEPVEG
jgi:tetratricopeptide (TPR) repeat protein